MDELPLNLDTPCIGVCSTVYGDDICRGCKRYYQEIIDWNQMNIKQKAAVLDRLNRKAKKVCSSFICVVDKGKLEKKLRQYKIKYHPYLNEYCWALTLLRYGYDKINNIENFGIILKERYTSLNLYKLFKLLDGELYKNSLLITSG